MGVSRGGSLRDFRLLGIFSVLFRKSWRCYAKRRNYGEAGEKSTAPWRAAGPKSSRGGAETRRRRNSSREKSGEAAHSTYLLASASQREPESLRALPPRCASYSTPPRSEEHMSELQSLMRTS